MESRIFVTTRELSAVADDLEKWFAAQGMDAQSFPGPSASTVVQAREKQAWKSALGMNRALTVSLTRIDDRTITANVGSGSWMDKAVVGSVSMVILWPLLVTTAIGTAQMMALPHRVFDALTSITQSEASFAQPVPRGHPAMAHVMCPQCGQPAAQGARFCQQCGSKLPAEPGPCASCGAPLAAGMRFCPACGTATTEEPVRTGSST